MHLPLGIEQLPVAGTAKYFADAAVELHLQIAAHGAGECAHTRHPDPARLLVRRRAQLAVAVAADCRLPVVHQSRRMPALNLGDKLRITRSEVLRTQIEVASLAALARHASAAATALVEQPDLQAGLLQDAGSRQAGDAAADDGDGSCHGGFTRVQ